jgi:amino acid transporter
MSLINYTDNSISLSFWSNINSLTGTPVNAVWLVVTFCSCLNLIGIGSTQTIVAIFNITAPALDLSYIAVIVAHRVYAHRVPFIEGPYTMGRWSRPVNAIAVVWVLFISVVLFFPPFKPVTAANMNYAICVAAVIALVSMTWWFTSAKK